MALSISGNLIIDQEFRTPSTGSADNEVTTLSADATLLAFLNGLNSSPDTGFPQYAERDDTASGATLSLVADTAGTPFPTSGVGISTGFSDIDGDSISLFAADASHPNVVGADRTFRLSKPLIDIEADAELAASKSAKAGARLVIGTRHEITAAGIETVLHAAGHTVAARSSCEADLVRALDAYRPDIIILAESIVGREATRTVSRLRARNGSVSIIFLLEARDAITASDLLDLDVQGILLSGACAASFIDCVRSVHLGRNWIDPDLLCQLAIAERYSEITSSLTSREADVAHLTSKGLHNKQIARELHLSEATVKMHLHHIYEKLQLSGRTQLALSMASVGARKVSVT